MTQLITLDRTTLEQAIAALGAMKHMQWDEDTHHGRALMEALRAALANAEPAQPTAWVLTEELDKRETTTRGHLWFTDPVNCMWTPIYTAAPAPVAQQISKAQYNRVRDDYNELLKKSERDALDGQKWREHVSRCQFAQVDTDHSFSAQQGDQPVCACCGIPAGDVHMSTCQSGKWPSRVSTSDTAAPAPQTQPEKELEFGFDTAPQAQCQHEFTANATYASAMCKHCGKPAPQPAQEPAKFLANGTRFKTSKFPGGVCITGMPDELAGRWVALVAAEDNCHLQSAQPVAPKTNDA